MLYICFRNEDSMKVLMYEDLKDLYSTGKSRKYKDVERTPDLIQGFMRAVSVMNSVNTVDELKGFSYLHYEQLKYQLTGYSSVRLSNRFVHRLIFRETPDGLEVHLIDVDDTHYGNK